MRASGYPRFPEIHAQSLFGRHPVVAFFPRCMDSAEAHPYDVAGIPGAARVLPPSTVKHLDDFNGDYLIFLRCGACRHAREVAPRELAARVGWAAELAAVARRLKCARCGARAVDVESPFDASRAAGARIRHELRTGARCAPRPLGFAVIG